MNKWIASFAWLLASCGEPVYADTPPQVINKTCSANQFFNKIAPGSGNITCLQPTYSGISNTPTFADSVQISSNIVTLINDLLTPGNSKYYGTDGSGVRGYFNLPVAANAVGTIDSQSPSSNGGVISGANLYFQSASSTNPGLVNNTTQTFSGAKSVTSILGLADAGWKFTSSPGTGMNLPSGNVMAFTTNSTQRLQIDTAKILAALPYQASDGTVGAPGFAIGSLTDGIYKHGTHEVGFTTNGIAAGYADASQNWTFIGTIGASNFSGTSSGANTGDVTIGTADGLSLVNQVLSLALSSTSTTGALSSTDWNTFNNKQAALSFGNFTDVGTDGITVTNGTGAVIGSGTSIAQHVSDTTHAGYLSSTDWNTFNGKQASGNYITALTSDVSASGPGSVAATVNSVGGSTASAVNTATVLANAATSANTASAIVKRDANGGFNSGAHVIVGSTDTAQLSVKANGTQTSNLAQVLNSSNSTLFSVTNAGVGFFASTLSASNFSGSSSGANTGDVTIGTANGLSLAGQALSLQTSSGSQTGALSSTDWTTFNSKQAAGNYITALTSDVSAAGPGSAAATVNSVGGSSAANIHTAELLANAATSANTASAIVKRGSNGEFSSGAHTIVGSADVAQLSAKANATQTTNVIQALDSSSGTLFSVTSAGVGFFSSTLSASNFSGSSSGTNTGDVTLAAVGSAPSGNGASLSGQVLTLQPADGTHPGLLTSGSQSIGGAKTFTGAISASNLSGTNTGDQTITLTGDVTGSGTGSFATTLATVATGATVGSSTSIPTFTFNNKGLVTSASGNAVIAPAGTLTGTTLASNVVSSSLTSVGTITSGTWNGTAIADANLAVSYTKADGTRAFTGIQSFASAGWNFSAETGLTFSRDAAGSTQLTSANTTATRFYLNSTGTNAAADIGALATAAGTGDAYMFLGTSGAASTWQLGQKTSASSQFELSWDSAALGGGTNALLCTTAGVCTFPGQLIGQGVAGNGLAAAGKIGEIIASSQTTLQNAPTTTQYGDITSITLTAGDWDISVNAEGVLNTGVAVLEVSMGIGTTTGNSSAGVISGITFHTVAPPTANYNAPVTIADYPVQLSGSTTYYLKMESTYTSGTPQFRGRIQGRRRR